MEYVGEVGSSGRLETEDYIYELYDVIPGVKEYVIIGKHFDIENAGTTVAYKAKESYSKINGIPVSEFSILMAVHAEIINGIRVLYWI